MFSEHGDWVETIVTDDFCHLHLLPHFIQFSICSQTRQEGTTLKQASSMPKIRATQEAIFRSDSGMGTSQKALIVSESVDIGASPQSAHILKMSIQTSPRRRGRRLAWSRLI